MTRRAQSQSETRDRIVAAAMALHEEVGLKGATISAVAQRAGVQRLTVYRHFEDDAALFDACTSRWLDINPPPDAVAWADITDGEKRARAAFTQIYRYYRATEGMWHNAHRDEADVPAVRAPMDAFRDWLGAVACDLVKHLAVDGERADALGVTVRHAVQFPTWRSLAGLGLNDEGIADLVISWQRGCLARVGCADGSISS